MNITDLARIRLIGQLASELQALPQVREDITSIAQYAARLLERGIERESSERSPS